MKEIIAWLTVLEERSYNLYTQTADFFAEDHEFAHFLKRLGEDEKGHLKMMHEAAGLVGGEEKIDELIRLDNQTTQEIDAHLLLWEEGLRVHTLTREAVVDLIVFIEYSEWNTLFLYVMNILKHAHKKFIPAIAGIQRHKEAIEHYLKTHPEFNQYTQKIKTLPLIWKEKLLIADDEQVIADLLIAVLENQGHIDHALNGQLALEKLREHYYGAIITDLNMPVMNGKEFYKKAYETYPNIKRRFLFLSGYLDPETLSFLKQNNLRYLQKPANISEIRKAVSEILTKQT